MKALILAAMAATAFVVGSPDRHRDIEEHYKTQPSQRVEIRGFSGSDIKIRSWDKNEVAVTLSISFASSYERDEQKFLDGITLKEDNSPDALTITYQEPALLSRSHYSFWSWLTSIFSGSMTSKRIEGEIYVPRSNSLTAEVKYGTVSLDGMSGSLSVLGQGNTVHLKDCSSVQEVTNDYGKTTIERCGGSLQLSSKSATITVDQFKGKASIDAKYSTITARDITESLAIYSTSGTIRAERIGGSATIRSNYTNITVSDVAGLVEIDDKSGKIRAMTVSGAKIRGEYTPIELGHVSGKGFGEIHISGQSAMISVRDAIGNLIIDNPYGNVDLSNVKGNIDLRAKSSRITADDIDGDWQSETEYCTIRVSGLNGKHATMRNRSGGIRLDLKTLPTLVDIRNEYADVSVDLPSGFKGDLDLQATYGHVESNIISKTTKTRPSRSEGIRTTGDGSVKIAVETWSGNVKVMQR